MKVEITHDIIAKKIFEKGSEEDKNFSRASRLVKERFVAFVDTKTYLTSRELDFIEPQIEALEATLPQEEYEFITRSQRMQLRQVRRKLTIVAFVGVLFGCLLLYLSMYYNKKFAMWTGVASKTEELVGQALQMMDNDPTIALNLANEALLNDPKNESAKQVIYLLYRDNIFYKDILMDSVSANSVAISPNNQFVAFAEKDKIYIKAPEEDNYLRIGNFHVGSINDLYFENDSVLLSVGDDNKLVHWNFRKNKVKEIVHTKRVLKDTFGLNIDLNALDRSADGRYIFLGRGAQGSDCLLVDTEQDTTYVIDDVMGRVHDVVFTVPDPEADLPILRQPLMVMVGDDRKILVYDLATRKLLAESNTSDHPKYIYSVAVKPNSTQIVTACNHDVIRVFDLVKNTKKEFSNLPYTIKRINRLTEHSDAVRSVRFSKDGLQMVSASYDNTAIIWDTRIWEPSYVLRGHTNRIYKAEFSQDGRYIVTCGRDKKVIIWNLNLKKPQVLPERHLRRVSSLAYTASGQRMYSGTWGNEQTPMRYLYTWNTKKWSLMAVDSFDNDIEAMAGFYKDSTLVAVSKSLYLLDKKYNTKQVIGRAEGTIKAVAIAPNNQYIVYAGRDDRVRVIPNRNSSNDIRTNIRNNLSSYVKDKKILTIRKDNAETDKDKDIYSLAISPDSKYLIAGRRNRTFIIWDMEENTQLMPPVLAHDLLYKTDNEIYSISFVDNTRFITTGRDNTIRVWQIDRDKQKLILLNKHHGHAGAIRCLAIHPSKELYISGGGDEQLKLWDMDGNLIQVIDAYYNDNEPCTGDDFKCGEDFGIVSAVSFSKDGSKIIFGNGNGKIKMIYTIEGAWAKDEIFKTDAVQ